MRVAYFHQPQHAETCEWCGAEITHITKIVENDGTEHILGPECGEKAKRAIYANECARRDTQRREQERQRMTTVRKEYQRRFGG